ncbi:SDR family oxidoreductase [Cellulosilyticum sp. I15G10I2]|uniref:SDR family oxidoreductase n=1 Tax=Cellulosilyticum sp. I15G10I2 TaxID=1892843 RepID=UPI00085C7416|nr:SDR family oxidoreductase [Cellulosilyticum sp. I15G10I2]
MEGKKVVLITGGNAGMGKAAASELAKLGNIVVIISRNKERGEKALEEIKRVSGNDEVDLMLCDLADLPSIRRLVSEFKKKYNRLDILINNAGVIVPKRRQTKDGFELQFGVNHLGHFLLTHLLLDTLIKSAPARIINVSSGAHKIGKIHFEDIHLKKHYNLIKAYAQSKLANVLFTYELADRLQGKGVTVNALHPGAVATKMGVDRETGFGTFITSRLKPFFQTPLEGAQTAIYLAVSKEVEDVTGKYFYDKKAIMSSRLSYDKAIAKRLWEVSINLVHLAKEN